MSEQEVHHKSPALAAMTAQLTNPQQYQMIMSEQVLAMNDSCPVTLEFRM